MAYQISVTGVDGEVKCVVEAELDWKVRQVKMAIQKEEGLEFHEQKLLVNGDVAFNDTELKTIFGDKVDVTVMLVKDEMYKGEDAADAAATAIQAAFKGKLGKLKGKAERAERQRAQQDRVA